MFQRLWILGLMLVILCISESAQAQKRPAPPALPFPPTLPDGQ